jgi:signal transduction histidine kinase
MTERPAPTRLVAGRWWGPALAVALTGAFLIELVARPELRDSPRAAIVLVLLGAPIALRRSHPLAAACLLAALALTAPYDDALPEVLISVVAYSCGAHASQRRGLLGVAALIVGMQLGTGLSEFPNVEIAFVTLGPWWIGSQLRRRRELVRELRERTAELEAEQDAFARLSVRRERARIAHELHDIVAHHLAVIVVQAGAGRMAPAGRTDEAVERLAAIRDSGGQALAEMARLVDVLGADTGDRSAGLGKLRVLVDQASSAGVAVRLTQLPSNVLLPADVEDAAYHVVREGLTNAIKHAPGATVHVRLGAPDGALEIEVRDTGAAGSSTLATSGSGLGLPGMSDRIEALGGSIDAAPLPGGGWRLAARLPMLVGAER